MFEFTVKLFTRLVTSAFATLLIMVGMDMIMEAYSLEGPGFWSLFLISLGLINLAEAGSFLSEPI